MCLMRATVCVFVELILIVDIVAPKAIFALNTAYANCNSINFRRRLSSMGINALMYLLSAVEKDVKWNEFLNSGIFLYLARSRRTSNAIFQTLHRRPVLLVCQQIDENFRAAIYGHENLTEYFESWARKMFHVKYLFPTEHLDVRWVRAKFVTTNFVLFIKFSITLTDFNCLQGTSRHAPTSQPEMKTFTPALSCVIEDCVLKELT